MKILIKSATIIVPSHPDHQQKRDLLIEDGVLTKIGKTIEVKADKTIAIDDLHVSLGWFDSSVSFGEPGYEERETLSNGMLTAAKSGFTAIALNPTGNPITDNQTGLRFLERHQHEHGVGLLPIGALTKASNGKSLAELYDMKNGGAVSFYDYKQPITNPNFLKIALQYAQGFDALIQSFPQDNAIARNGVVHEHEQSTHLGLKGIPALAEELQISRDLFILEYTGGKLHIPTISTEKSVTLLKGAKQKGLDVSCSVSIHHLFFTDKQLTDFDTNAKVLPPLRTENDRKALLEGLQDGTIDMITSDHFPLDVERKKVEFENADFGTIGLESAFGALQKLLGLEKSIELLTRGRSRFGKQEPVFKEGEKANLSLFIPSKTYQFSEKDIYSTAKNSIFNATELTGKAVGIIANDQITLAHE